MADNGEKFVARWSRLKHGAREQAENPPAPKPESPADPSAPPPALPPLERLSFDSDYRGFFHPAVDEDTRRAALKKLFADARFNVIDDMDIDIEDYSKYAPLSAAVVASLRQTQNILEWARQKDGDERQGASPVGETESAAAALPANTAGPDAPVPQLANGMKQGAPDPGAPDPDAPEDSAAGDKA